MALLFPSAEQPFTIYGDGEPFKDGYEFKTEDGASLKTQIAPGLGLLVIEAATNQPILPPTEWQPNFRAMATLQAMHDTVINSTAA